MSDLVGNTTDHSQNSDDSRAVLTVGVSRANLKVVRSLATALGAVAFVASIALLSFSYSSPKGTDALIEAVFGLAIFFGVLWWAWYSAQHLTQKQK